MTYLEEAYKLGAQQCVRDLEKQAFNPMAVHALMGGAVGMVAAGEGNRRAGALSGAALGAGLGHAGKMLGRGVLGQHAVDFLDQARALKRMGNTGAASEALNRLAQFAGANKARTAAALAIPIAGIAGGGYLGGHVAGDD